jgi:transposase
MQLKQIARELPEEIWAELGPHLPPVVWCGNGRKPYSNEICLHALLYVLVSGISWDMLPAPFPSGKTVQRRLKRWVAEECFRRVWSRLAQRYQETYGINWDQILLDGARRPAKKGGSKRAPTPLIVASRAPDSTWRVTAVPCRSAS